MCVCACVCVCVFMCVSAVCACACACLHMSCGMFVHESIRYACVKMCVANTTSKNYTQNKKTHKQTEHLQGLVTGSSSLLYTLARSLNGYIAACLANHDA